MTKNPPMQNKGIKKLFVLVGVEENHIPMKKKLSPGRKQNVNAMHSLLTLILKFIDFPYLHKKIRQSDFDYKLTKYDKIQDNITHTVMQIITTKCASIAIEFCFILLYTTLLSTSI